MCTIARPLTSCQDVQLYIRSRDGKDRFRFRFRFESLSSACFSLSLSVSVPLTLCRHSWPNYRPESETDREDPGQFAWCTVRNWLVNQIGCCRNTFHNCQAFQHPLSNCQLWVGTSRVEEENGERDSRNRCSRSARFTTQAEAQLRVSHSLGPHTHSTHSLVYSFILFVQRAVQGEAFNSNT